MNIVCLKYKQNVFQAIELDNLFKTSIKHEQKTIDKALSDPKLKR